MLSRRFTPEGRSRPRIASVGKSDGWTTPRSSAAAASAICARRNGWSAGKRAKNSSPVTARREAPPVEFMYPHVFVSRAAKASVAPLRTWKE